jgi:uncharacterized membrane protein
MGGGMMNGGFGNFWWMGGLSMLVNLAIIVGIVLLVLWAVQKLSRSPSHTALAGGPGPSQTFSAREVLDLRYAKGELTREHYQTMLADISAKS